MIHLKLSKQQREGYHFCVEMKREIRVFDSFAEAEEADYEYYRSLTGDEKLELMLKIMAPVYEANPGFGRVYRVVDAHGIEYLRWGLEKESLKEG